MPERPDLSPGVLLLATKAVRRARDMSLCGLCDREHRMIRCTCREIAEACIKAYEEAVTLKGEYAALRKAEEPENAE